MVFSFFLRKVLKFVQAQINLFRAFTCVFFKIQFISFFQRKKNATIERQKSKVCKKRDRFLVLKVELNL